MNTRQIARLKTLLQTALPPTHDGLPSRDLWPDLRRRIAAESEPTARFSIPWFDWALAGGVALVAVVFPAAVPLFFYYL
jgi:hypothetical protein